MRTVDSVFLNLTSCPQVSLLKPLLPEPLFHPVSQARDARRFDPQESFSLVSLLGKRVQCVPPGKILFRQGELLPGVFAVTRGLVKLSTVSPKGRTTILQIVRQGDLLGLADLLSSEPSDVTAETMRRTDVVYVDRESFYSYFDENPQSILVFARDASFHYQSACKRIAFLQATDSISARTAQFLVEWSDSISSGGELAGELDFTHEELGQIIGCSRETMTRTLGKFRDKGWVSQAESGLLVKNRHALRGVALSRT